MLRVTFDNGTVREFDPEAAVEIENYPPRDSPKEGWERTRDYPPEYRRFNNFRAGILAKGHRVRMHDGIHTVTLVERM